MKRLAGAFALACLPTLIAAQAPASDRLTLDLYLEYETVSDPQISPDGAQIIYTRGWVDKQNDRRESSLWIMNADGSKNRFLVRGSNARWSPTGDRIAYTAQGEPRGIADLRPLHGRRRRDLADHARREGAERRRVVARRHAHRLHDERRSQERPGRSRCRARPRAPSGSRRRASSSASTTARTAPASTTTAIGMCSWCRPPAARRAS